MLFMIIGLMSPGVNPFDTDRFRPIISPKTAMVTDSFLIRQIEIAPNLMYDSQAVITAMDSTKNNKFICWKRSPIRNITVRVPTMCFINFRPTAIGRVEFASCPPTHPTLLCSSYNKSLRKRARRQ